MTVMEFSFSAAEFERRRVATLALARDVGASAVLAFGENRSGVHVPYLTGWSVTRLAYVRLTADGCTMWVQFHNHTPNARRLAYRTDVRDVDDSMIPALLGSAKTIATLGQVPHPIRQAAQAAGIELVAIDGKHNGLRIIKSVEEVEALRLGALASDVGARALIDACVPGATDWDLLAAARSAYTRVGGRDHICYICVTDMNNPDRDVPSQVPEGRVVGQGSVVTFELSASVSPEYPGQILRTVTIGAPTEDYARLHEVAMTARASVRAAMRSGVPAADLIGAASCIEDSGFTTTDDLFHGLGMGYLEPIGTSPSRIPPHVPTTVLASGMSIVVQPNVTFTNHGAGVQVGEMVIVTDDGITDIHEIPAEMVQR